MNRIDRLTAILIQLQGKTRVPMTELEERFELSRRTLFRDIKSLIETGVPIGGDAGDGYFIVDGYHLPPVVFNKEEAAAILLGAKMLERNADNQVMQHFSEAMFKIKAVLKYRDKEFLENLENSISVLPSRAVQAIDFPDSHIAEIQLALASRKNIEITYHSNYKDQKTSRKVSPLGLVFYGSRWHLIGYCLLRSDLRDFRTDRIERIYVLPESYDPAAYPDFQEFVSRMVGGSEANEATLRFTHPSARFIQEQKFQYGYVSERKEADYIEMEFLTPHYEYIARWILMFGKDVTVVSPSKLQGRVAQLSQELFAHHQQYFVGV